MCRNTPILLLAGLLVAGLTNVAGAQELAGAAAATADGSPLEAVLFYATAAAVAMLSIGCVISRSIVRMATCLFGTLGSVAILYFLMSATFIGAIQLIVYAGGTLIVIVFGVMLTNQSPQSRFEPKEIEFFTGAAVVMGLFFGLVVALLTTSWPENGGEVASYSVATIGRSLLTTYLVPFEVVSVLLLAVMIGAAYLVRRERE